MGAPSGSCDRAITGGEISVQADTAQDAALAVIMVIRHQDELLCRRDPRESEYTLSVQLDGVFRHLHPCPKHTPAAAGALPNSALQAAPSSLLRRFSDSITIE